MILESEAVESVCAARVPVTSTNAATAAVFLIYLLIISIVMVLCQKRIDFTKQARA